MKEEKTRLQFFEDDVLRNRYEEKIYFLLQQIKNFSDEKEKELGREVISHTRQRLKEYDSAVSKLRKKKRALTDENLFQYINDLAGLRIVCLFIDDIYMIQNFIRTIPGVVVVKEKDYVKKPRKSGYQSIHMIVMFDNIYKVEIQIRTLAMDFWSVLEYQLQYKKKKTVKTLKNEIYDCAMDIRKIEQRMLVLRETIEISK